MATKLTKLADGVVMATPSPRIRVLWHHNQGNEHVIAYLGFATQDAADTCCRWLIGKVGKYSRNENAGVCKPRKAERIEGVPIELKWHAPDAEILAQAIEKDLARAAVPAKSGKVTSLFDYKIAKGDLIGAIDISILESENLKADTAKAIEFLQQSGQEVESIVESAMKKYSARSRAHVPA